MQWDRKLHRSPPNGPLCPRLATFLHWLNFWQKLVCLNFILENEVEIDCIPQIDSRSPTEILIWQLGQMSPKRFHTFFNCHNLCCFSKFRALVFHWPRCGCQYLGSPLLLVEIDSQQLQQDERVSIALHSIGLHCIGGEKLKGDVTPSISSSYCPCDWWKGCILVWSLIEVLI